MNEKQHIKKEYQRFGYNVIYPDGSVYIGITKNFEKRKYQRRHDPNDACTIYANKTGQDYTMRCRRKGMSLSEAQEYERNAIERATKQGKKVFKIELMVDK
jgi:predicted GIY-YIG superfamily endonuclease